MKLTYFSASALFASATSILLTAPFAHAQTPPAAASTPPPTVPRPSRPAPEPYAPSETPDFPGAVWEPASPFNFQKMDRPTGEHPINCIVIHDIEGSAISAVRWFQNPAAQVTAHYVVGADGTVYQLVKERDMAWHAGNRDINRRSVGIEHDGFAYRPGFYNPAEYEASARLVRSIALRYQIPRDRVHIFGHAEVPNAGQPGAFGGSSGHTDPGPYWDWDYFMAAVRNDAALAAPTGGTAAPTAPIQLHPGEKGTAVFSLTNTGDDAWPVDAKPPRPNPELRGAGPVYLGPANPAPSPGPLFGQGWISPRFAASPDSTGEVPPEQTAPFTVPLTGSRTLGTQTEMLRLWKVFPAPRAPVPFGPSVSLAVSTVPWDITAPLPPTPPVGWTKKSLPDDTSVFWRSAIVGVIGESESAIWSVTLPISGYWDIYVREVPGTRTSAPPIFRIQSQDTGMAWMPAIAQTTENGWRKIVRYPFGLPPKIVMGPIPRPSPGVRPGAPMPDAPLTVTLSLFPASSKHGVLVAGDVRFVGPFPSAQVGPTQK